MKRVAVQWTTLVCMVISMSLTARVRAETKVVAVNGDLIELAGDALSPGPTEIWHEGRMVGFGLVGEDGKARRVLGLAPAGATLRPVGMPPRRVVMVAPDPTHPAIAEVRLLFKDLRVVGSPNEFAQLIRERPDAAIALSNPADVLASVPAGTTLFCSLDAYAAARGLRIQRHEAPKPPALRLTHLAPWLSGLQVNQLLPWYGKVNEGFVQRSLSSDGLPPSAQVHAVSTIDDGPGLISEKLPGGGLLIALDLDSPNGKPGHDGGSKYKWYFLSRLLDPRPFYGEFISKKPTFEEYVQGLRELAERHPRRMSISEVGKGAAGDPVISVRMGVNDAPRFVFSAAIHGAEIQNVYGIRRLLEVLLDNPGNDPRISELLGRYGVEVLPIVNAWGYIHGNQVNSRDCDLNRNFDYKWQEYKGDGGWRAKYKPEVLRGATPFSEGEARALHDRLLDGKVAGYIDFHQHEMKHGHLLWLPDKAVQRETAAFLFLHQLLNARLTGRYLFGDSALQLRINAGGSATPFAQNWAAARGIPSCVFELPGGFEDSLILTDVLVQEALNFMWVLDACRRGMIPP